MTNLIVVRTFFEGGWVMYPILITSIVGLSVIIERFIWWQVETHRREPGKLESVFTAVEKNQFDEALELAASSQDSILRVVWFGLCHRTGSLQGAFQAAAGIELERAGRFVVVLDTIVTLAPLLGLLGTVTGLMRAFFKLGTAELTEQAIGGGIAEALIATACGLSIAVVCLIFLNYYAARVAKLQRQLQFACGSVEVFLRVNPDDDASDDRIHFSTPEATDTSSLMPPSLGAPDSPPTI
jgi:biopolymer transport protein ExbB